MKFLYSLVLAASFQGILSTVAAESEAASQAFPICEMYLRDFHVAPKYQRSVVRISAELVSRLNQPFLIEIPSLVSACRRARLRDSKGVEYMIDYRNELDGPSYAHFQGEALLLPGKTNHISLEILAGDRGLVIVNHDYIPSEIRDRRPTSLTYIVFADLVSDKKRAAGLTDATQNGLREIIISGCGDTPVSWESR